MTENLATDQGKMVKPGVSPISGVAPPENRQFGKKDGNPRNPGGWRKADTPRYKMEQMLKLPRNKLADIANDTNAPGFERSIAEAILKGKSLDDICRIINQVYGMPRSAAPEGTIQRPKPEDMIE